MRVELVFFFMVIATKKRRLHASWNWSFHGDHHLKNGDSMRVEIVSQKCDHHFKKGDIMRVEIGL